MIYGTFYIFRVAGWVVSYRSQKLAVCDHTVTLCYSSEQGLGNFVSMYSS